MRCSVNSLWRTVEASSHTFRRPFAQSITTSDNLRVTTCRTVASIARQKNKQLNLTTSKLTFIFHKMLTNIIARPYDAVTFPHLNGIKNYTQVVLVWLLHSESEKKTWDPFSFEHNLGKY